MIWFLCVIVVVIMGLAVMAGSGKFGDVPATVDDRPVPDLPEGEISPADIRNAKFATVRRGYSPAQVDALLDRLASQMSADPAMNQTGDPDSRTDAE